MRTLKLIAKILQTLTNFVDENSSKESYMSEIGDFIQENTPLMKKFIDDISVLFYLFFYLSILFF